MFLSQLVLPSNARDSELTSHEDPDLKIQVKNNRYDVVKTVGGVSNIVWSLSVKEPKRNSFEAISARMTTRVYDARILGETLYVLYAESGKVKIEALQRTVTDGYKVANVFEPKFPRRLVGNIFHIKSGRFEIVDNSVEVKMVGRGGSIFRWKLAVDSTGFHWSRIEEF